MYLLSDKNYLYVGSHGFSRPAFFFNRIVIISVWAFFLLHLSVIPVNAQYKGKIINAQYNENIIKAANIERITRFIEWPDNDRLFIHDSFVIGVFDEDDFYNTLTEIFKEKHIKDHKVTIIRIKNPEEINLCNLCYLSEKAEPIISEFIKAAQHFGVLLFSGTTNFGKSGVHINFYIEDEKLKFEINKKTIDTAGFDVSYLLMSNARIIE